MTNCLTYKQLQDYMVRKTSKTDSEQIYQHISTCELCACAVNGFSALPFTSDDLVAIHREIDVRTNTIAVKPLTLAQVFIVSASLLAIFGVYKLTDRRTSVDRTTTTTITEVPEPLTIVNHETKSESQKEISAVTASFKKIVTNIRHKKFEQRLSVPETMESISPITVVLAEPEKKVIEKEEILIPIFNSDVIYIYDLKVTDYNKLYFGHYKGSNVSFRTHTPVFKENKTSEEDDFGVETHIIPADRVLKEGLEAFNRQKYKKALENFDLLIENDPSDINAQFYAGLSNYNLQRLEKALSHLQIVLQNPNNTFYPEAQYYQAIANLRSGEKNLARQQLQAIVAEKGFYAKKAKERLKAL